MDLADRLDDLASRISQQRAHVTTEEATKNALVMPFISALSYDVFNPVEVVPEFTADVGIKKGEKVDYVIMRDGKPAILIECKSVGTDLDQAHASQLYRYFSVTDARFGVLTNGIEYRFFTDLEASNKMDARPFLEINLLAITDRSVEELKKFTKETFDLEQILSTASDLKYTKGIKRAISEEWVNPSEELVRYFGSKVYSGRMTQAVRDQFTTITKRALQEFISDRVSERLKSALAREEDMADKFSSSPDDPETESDSSGIETTEEEIEGYYIVKSIVREVVDAKRVFMRDTQSYCGILLDDNNRKPVCRLYFNASQKYVGVLDEKKNVDRHPIETVDEIFKFADQLKQTALRY